VILLLAAGCAHAPRDREPSGKTPPEHPGSSDTAAETTTTPGPTGPRVGVSPSARVFGVPNLLAGGPVGMVSATPTDPSLLLLGASRAHLYPEEYPWIFAIDGNVPPGDNQLLDLWDGVSSFDYYMDEIHPVPAGDADGDGDRDLWLGQGLYTIPLLGNAVRMTEDDVAYSSNDGDQVAVAGGFDADDDGFDDVLFQEVNGHRAFLYYGPFAGDLPEPLAGPVDPATYSSFGEDQGCSRIQPLGRILEDHLRPGRPAIAIGWDNPGFCSIDTYVWDFLQPRGTHLRYDQAFGSAGYFGTTMSDGGLYDAGDVDQDGHPDVILSEDSSGILISGPADFFVGWSDQLPTPRTVANGMVTKAVGDMNGDGQPELIGVWGSDATSYWGTLMLLFSPFPEPLDVSKGVILGNYDDHEWIIGKQWADLDGDGRADLVDWRVGDQEEGVLSIYYGKDLLAAWQQQSGD
jgi:hypothetical protein